MVPNPLNGKARWVIPISVGSLLALGGSGIQVLRWGLSVESRTERAIEKATENHDHYQQLERRLRRLEQGRGR